MNTKSYMINSQKAISETLEGETIIINLETGTYYSMNPAGTALWNAIAAGRAIPTNDPVISNFLSILETDGLISEAETTGDSADASEFANPHIETYTDMQEMLLADPIHDVDQAGWPNMKKED
jgi:hypothetical protein